MPEPPKNVTINARPFSALVQDQPLPWTPPKRDLFIRPERADFAWKRLIYVFGFENPADFTPPRVSFTDSERELVKRFVEHSSTLAGTSLISATDTMNVSFTARTEDITTTLSAPDVTTGFMVMMRQCFAKGEEASFAKVRKALERRVHDTGDEDSLAVLVKWRKAHARLLNYDLEALVQEQLIRDKRMPGTTVDQDGERRSLVIRAPASPHEMLRMFWYSHQVHWGSTRNEMSAILADPYAAGTWEIATRQAAVDLTHLYIGYAVLAEAVLTNCVLEAES